MTEPLHHCMYLTAYDTAAQNLFDRPRTGFLLRAAVLTELAIRGHLTEVEGAAAVAAAGSTGDSVLDKALGDVGAHRRSWKAWLRYDRKETLEAVEHQLAALGVLTIEEKEKSSFGRGSKRQLTVTDPVAVKALQDGASAILHARDPADRLAPADAALLALAAAGGIPAVLSRKDSRDHKDRIEALTDRLGDIAPGLDKAVHSLRITMIAAQGGMGGS
ncbi:GOLPH3/VPS74 family protein [Streptomyces inhibens]|uniref:GOLPH3/VPS74 family protein n=1 Tax=Streptomyces inhibens TaxID=2293571 RepID=UPI001EE6FC28|nr:GPP34 family phosphoprotein [Streptomyces inhibens]UKY47567.1 GPP34 family phosphoprotein [Streptomyces inhibens]